MWKDINKIINNINISIVGGVLGFSFDMTQKILKTWIRGREAGHFFGFPGGTAISHFVCDHGKIRTETKLMRFDCPKCCRILPTRRWNSPEAWNKRLEPKKSKKHLIVPFKNGNHSQTIKFLLGLLYAKGHPCNSCQMPSAFSEAGRICT